MKKEVADQVAEMVLSQAQIMTMINNSAMNSKDGIVSACSLQIIGLLQKHLITIKREISVLKLDFNKLMDIFEKNVGSG